MSDFPHIEKVFTLGEGITLNQINALIRFLRSGYLPRLQSHHIDAVREYGQISFDGKYFFGPFEAGKPTAYVLSQARKAPKQVLKELRKLKVEEEKRKSRQR